MKKDYKNWIQIVSFIIMMGGLLLTWSNGRTERALTNDQVRRNTELLEKYNLVLIDHKLNTLIELLDE